MPTNTSIDLLRDALYKLDQMNERKYLSTDAQDLQRRLRRDATRNQVQVIANAVLQGLVEAINTTLAPQQTVLNPLAQSTELTSRFVTRSGMILAAVKMLQHQLPADSISEDNIILRLGFHHFTHEFNQQWNTKILVPGMVNTFMELFDALAQ